MKLKELSETLGLSQTTVSRALNDYPEVSEVTRHRVKQAAAKGNYRPDKRASGLATGKARAIGHVIPLATQDDVFSPIFAEFIASASRTYSQFGYELMLSLAKSQDEESIYRDLAATRAVDGVILHSPLIADPRLELLKNVGLPFVVHGRVLDGSNYNWVDMDNKGGFKHATQLLIDLGHKRIALINGNIEMTFAWSRKAGFEEALKENGLTPCDELIASDDLTEPYGYQTAKTMLAGAQRPTAFLVSSYVAALGVRGAISQAGLVIGNDISVIIHDDELSYFDNGGVVPQFTSTRSSIGDAGNLAARMLLDQINNPDRKPGSHLMDTQLVIGSSTGPCRS